MDLPPAYTEKSVSISRAAPEVMVEPEVGASAPELPADFVEPEVEDSAPASAPPADDEVRASVFMTVFYNHCVVCQKC